MMKRVAKPIIWLGVLLVIASLGIMLFLHITASNAQKQSDAMLEKLSEILPDEYIGVAEGYSYSQMPALELEGEDVVALLTIPQTSTKLCVGAAWNNEELISFPHRFSGSAYNGTLVIGGYDREGQFDCLEKLDIGYEVFVTDMTGARFSYKVERIDRKKSVDADYFKGNNSALTLFSQDESTQDYIIAICN